VHFADRVVQLAGTRWMTLRLLAAVLERRARLTHVIGEMHAWHLVRALGRRPILFTVTIPGRPLPKTLLDKVAVFAVESEALAGDLAQAGVGRERIRIVYPGVDLSRFSPPPLRQGRFTVVFASSPSSPDHFEARGIPLLVETARLCPELDIRIMWRNWGQTDALRRALAALHPPANVINEWGDVVDMAAVYRGAHAAIFLPASNYGKSCPNSIVEALACGCPAIVSEGCGIAAMLDETGCGLQVRRVPSEVANALRKTAIEYSSRTTAARATAVLHFDSRQFFSAYRSLYSEMSGG
jgi:glycosyltransferase involved in cell wall biosynthesis